MLTRELFVTGGMGYVVAGGAETTGVLVLLESLLLQAVNNIKLQTTTTNFLCVPPRLLRPNS
jgi:hypothetical protein